MGKMDGKVLLCFGGASGMGRAAALRFGKEGTKVIISDLPTQDSDSVVREITESGGSAESVPCDCTEPNQVQIVIDAIMKKYGKIDSMIYMPGSNPLTRLMDLSLEVWDKFIKLNLTSCFVALQKTARAMKETGGGSIILVSSINTTCFRERFGCYNVTKSGIERLTEMAAIEMGQYNIRVNCIAPGYINSPIMRRILSVEGNIDRIKAVSPLGRLGESSDFGKLALFLCSDDAYFVDGQIIKMDGAAAYMGYPDIMGPFLKSLNDPRY